MVEKIISTRDRLKLEIWNSITHGLGVVIGIVFLVLLILKGVYDSNVTAIVAYSIYGGCFILMFLMSTLYHAIQNKKVKSVFRIFDHISIFYFIAGTFTPAILLLTQGWFRISFLIAIWVLAFAGTIYNVSIKGKFDKYKSISVGLYIAMGWLGIFLLRPIILNNLWHFAGLIIIGGLLYTVGTIFYKAKNLKYNHVIWHLFVLSAAIVHFNAIYFYL